MSGIRDIAFAVAAGAAFATVAIEEGPKANDWVQEKLHSYEESHLPKAWMTGVPADPQPDPRNDSLSGPAPASAPDPS